MKCAASKSDDWNSRLDRFFCRPIKRFAVFSLLIGCFVPARLDADERPNVIVLLADDLGYGELGCQGNPEIPTPHIDSMAKNGVRCTSAYVTAPYCSPSRAGLLTGRYQTRFGHEFNPVGQSNLDPRAGLPLSERTLANVLKDAGYATGLVGKWHLGGTAAHHPLARGFDEFYGFLHEGHFFVPTPYDGVTSFLRRKELPLDALGTRYREGKTIYSSHMGSDEPKYDDHNPILRGRREVVEKAHLTDAFTREAVAFIERHRSRPFFLYLAYNAVHSPMQGADNYLERFSTIEDVHRRVFAAMLSHLDDSVGTILKTLREQNLNKRTLVIFLSDHGGPTKELTSSNLPLRGGKGDLYEGGIRVPFLVQWPGELPAGRVYGQAVAATDVFATACALANVRLPANVGSDGVNLLPYWKGEQDGSPHDVLYWRMGTKAALQHKAWKLVRNAASAESPFELYDLSEDPGEQNDRAADRPDILRDLTGRWRELDREMAPPVWQRDRK